MPKVGLVLSGGIAKGAYQVGAIRAIERYLAPDEIAVVSASSVGVLNAIGLCSGNMSRAEELWLSVNEERARINVYSLLKSDRFRRIVDTLISMFPLRIPLISPIFRLRDRRLLYEDLRTVENVRLADRLYAAVSFIMPHKIAGELFYDGSLFDNIPILPMQNYELDYLICIHFDKCNYFFDTPEINEKTVEISFHKENLLEKSLFFRRDTTRLMIEEGERYTAEILDFVFRDGKEAEAVRRRIAELDAAADAPKLRITMDTVCNNLNKISKRLARIDNEHLPDENA